MASYLCGIDIGGTFTDCVIVDQGGRVVTAKAPSTPADFAGGMMAALEAAAGELDMEAGALCREIALLCHGTTVGTNAIIQKKGARIGLITTKGHNDVIHIMRGSRGLTGRDIRLVVHIPESSKPDPIVPKSLIEGVSERVDCFGKVVVALNESEAEAAIRRLVEKGVDAIAVCFLWSFLEPAHERRVKAMIEEVAPDLFVTCSCDLVPKWGEYERTAAVALNAYIGPLTTGYLERVDRQVHELGYQHPLQITHCAGGTISLAKARTAPLLTLDSGPVSGVMGSKYVGDLMGYDNVITTDMGGTSFDVGIIQGGAPAFSFKSLVHQYEYYLSKVDIQTIGAGGGSLAWIDEATSALRVGPESAGAEPGPVCYGRGGSAPTVTDADLVLGYLDAENFAGGRIALDKPAAEAAIQAIAERLGLGL
jgi:N-methylhydantoinase A